MDLIEYLESKNVEVNRTSGPEIHITCPVCDPESEKRAVLYIHADEYSDKYGVHVCHRCNTKGGLNTLRKLFGDEPITTGGSTRPKDFSRIMEVACQYYEERLTENPEAYEYLSRERGLYDKTIKKARLGYADGNLGQHLSQKGFSKEDIQDSGLVNAYGQDFFKNVIIIPYLHYGFAITLRGRQLKDGSGPKYQSLPGAPALLYNTDELMGRNAIAITEGELCSLHLSQIGVPAIGVPGANIFKDEWFDQLEHVMRINLIYDSDRAGKDGAESAATKIGPRARIVELPIAKIDVEEYIFNHGKSVSDIEYLIRKAKGGLIVRIDEAYDRWLELEGNADRVGLSFNVKELDGALSYGMLPANVITIICRTNGGKSLMGINMMQRIQLVHPDTKMLYISLEQTRNEVFERLNRIFRFYNPEADDIDARDYWNDRLVLVDKNNLKSHELEEVIYQSEYELGDKLKFVFLDYIGYFAAGFPNQSERDRVTSAMRTIKATAKDTQTTILTASQSNRDGDYGKELSLKSARDSSEVENASDLILTQWALDQREDEDARNEPLTGDIYQRVKKSRSGGNEMRIKYRMDPFTLAIVPHSDTEHFQRVNAMRKYMHSGHDWRTVIKKYLANDNTY